MRFVVVFMTGITAGYMLHNRKDQTIESVATGAVSFLENRTSSIRRRFADTSVN